MPDPTRIEWWLLEGQTPHGPYPHDEIEQRLKSGTVLWTTAARRSGSTEWKALASWTEFHAQPPVPVRPPPTPPVPPVATALSVDVSPTWHRWLPVAIGAGALVVLMGTCCTCGVIGSFSPADPQAQLLAQIKAADAQYLEQHKQEVFNAFHPIGTAKSIVLHDVSIASSDANQPRLVYRFTIYWQGPITQDGFTNVQTVLDVESGRVVDSRILETNGVTNAQAEQMAFDFGRLLGEFARQEQQRHQQEQLMRQLRGS